VARVTRRPPLRFDPIAEAERQWTDHGWGDAAPGMAAVTSVVRAEQIFLARIDESLRPFGITFARYEVLMLLVFSRVGALPMGKLSERLQVRAGSITNAVDRLEADGLVRRVPHPTDGRTTLAEITDTGRGLARRATARLNREVFTRSGLDRDDLQLVIDALRRLRQGHGDFA
jgi:DNA-binding MarR family transcriptional regulator